MSETINKIDDGGPAFPQALATCDGVIYDSSEKGQQVGGMTLRDYFAAKAMAALMPDDCFKWEDVASDSYKMADAMLAARKESR